MIGKSQIKIVIIVTKIRDLQEFFCYASFFLLHPLLSIAKRRRRNFEKLEILNMMSKMPSNSSKTYKRGIFQKYRHSMQNSVSSHNLWLKKSDIEFIQSTFKKVWGISRIRIFGSRAKWNYKPGSDIDIAYEGNISHLEKSKIWSTLTYDAPFLYPVDLLDYHKSAPELQEHIDRVRSTSVVSITGNSLQ